jgi:hypothetical protein
LAPVSNRWQLEIADPHNLKAVEFASSSNAAREGVGPTTTTLGRSGPIGGPDADADDLATTEKPRPVHARPFLHSCPFVE